MCCEGRCVCGQSQHGNRYRGNVGELNTCQCEPVEEVCVDSQVGFCRNLSSTYTIIIAVCALCFF